MQKSSAMPPYKDVCNKVAYEQSAYCDANCTCTNIKDSTNTNYAV